MKTFGASSKTLMPAMLGLLFLCCVDSWGQSSPAAATSPVTNAPSTQTGSTSSPAPSPQDWNVLKLPGSLKYPDAMPPVMSNLPDFTRELVQLTSRPGDIIDLYVMKPKDVKNPPVILYLYSFPTDTDRFKADDFGKLATRNGFAAVGFVSALTGHRFHDRPMKEWFVSELHESLVTSVHDVQLILNYLDKRNEFDMTRVGMFGEGSGASIAIMAASVDPRIKVVDLFDAWGDWPDWIAHSTLILQEDERAQYMKPEFLKNVEGLDPVEYLPELKAPRVRIEYLDTDTVTPAPARERLEAAAPPNSTVVDYAKPADFLQKEGRNGKMLDWLKEQLVPALAAKGTGAGNTAPQPAPAPQPATAGQASPH